MHNRTLAQPTAYTLAPLTLGGILRVVPVVMQLSNALTVISLEVYEEGVAVRWLNADPDRLRVVDRLEDDFGTDYIFDGSSRSASVGAPARGETRFTPSIPDRAQVVSILSERDTLDVLLS